MPHRDPILTPELVKILKIFGFGSLIFVLILSFFNTYRASNSGEDLTFRYSDSARIYFLNLKAINYDREFRKDAGMTLYRHNGFVQTDSFPGLVLALILNPAKDEAYLYLEPYQTEWPLELQIEGSSDTLLELKNGNKFDHLQQIEQLLPYLSENADFSLLIQNQKIPIWSEESEREALKATFEDYFRLIDL